MPHGSAVVAAQRQRRRCGVDERSTYCQAFKAISEWRLKKFELTSREKSKREHPLKSEYCTHPETETKQERRRPVDARILVCIPQDGRQSVKAGVAIDQRGRVVFVCGSECATETYRATATQRCRGGSCRRPFWRAPSLGHRRQPKNDGQ